ncbi:MAG: type II toxin-antitoxin system RelE/ParE family toxin [Sumerlaeia bacterium]
MKSITSAAAEFDLAEISLELERRTSGHGFAFLAAAERTFEDLAQSPRAGRVWEESGDAEPPIRIWRVDTLPHYLIFYCVFEDHLRVLRICHVRRNLDIDAVIS